VAAHLKVFGKTERKKRVVLILQMVVSTGLPIRTTKFREPTSASTTPVVLFLKELLSTAKLMVLELTPSSLALSGKATLSMISFKVKVLRLKVEFPQKWFSRTIKLTKDIDH